MKKIENVMDGFAKAPLGKLLKKIVVFTVRHFPAT